MFLKSLACLTLKTFPFVNEWDRHRTSTTSPSDRVFHLDALQPTVVSAEHEIEVAVLAEGERHTVALAKQVVSDPELSEIALLLSRSHLVHRRAGASYLQEPNAPIL